VSQENVDRVLACYAWGNRERKFARPWWHEDGEYVNAREDPDHATYRGVEAIERLVASWMEAYPDVTVEPLQARASGDRVFVWARFSGIAAGSRIPVTTELAHVITLSEGRIRRLEEFFDRAEALRVAGLSEQATSQQNTVLPRRPTP
jgi:ketosteroid isomerase-like protein